MRRPQYEVSSIRYSNSYDTLEDTVPMEIDDFYLILGTHIIPRENLTKILVNGLKMHLKYEGDKDLIVQVKQRKTRKVKRF